MGCGSSDTAEQSTMKKKNKALENELADKARQEAEKIKLLLLGAGESGKSTIFKQMKVIYGEIYSDAERKQQLPTIYRYIGLFFSATVVKLILSMPSSFALLISLRPKILLAATCFRR